METRRRCDWAVHNVHAQGTTTQQACAQTCSCSMLCHTAPAELRACSPLTTLGLCRRFDRKHTVQAVRSR